MPYLFIVISASRVRALLWYLELFTPLPYWWIETIHSESLNLLWSVTTLYSSTWHSQTVTFFPYLKIMQGNWGNIELTIAKEKDLTTFKINSKISNFLPDYFIGVKQNIYRIFQCHINLFFVLTNDNKYLSIPFFMEINFLRI